MPAKTKTWFALGWLPRILLAFAVLAADMAFVPTIASAQEQSRGGGLLRGLFMRREPVERVEPRQTVRPRARQQRRVRRERQMKRQPERARRATAAAAAPASEPAAARKLDNARTVMVVGDFLGGGLAEGLEAVFAESSGIRVLDRTNGSSGFVRDDFYDWPGEIGAILDADKPSAVVVMIGSNDRQEIGGAAVLSPDWTAEYESRIESFTTAIGERSIPLVWVGMPAFKSNSMSSDMLAFNDIYRRAAENTGGVFVDIWDGFVDEAGNFVTRGPDVNGQSVQLRSSDGINLTRDGKRKVAFYVEKPLERILGDTAAPEMAVFGPEIPPGLGQGPLTAPAAINRTLPVALDDPELDGGMELLGAAPRPAPNGNLSPVERLTIEGVAPAPPPGRADDFLRRQAPRPAAAAATPEAEETGAVMQ